MANDASSEARGSSGPLRVLLIETGETGTGGSFESLYQMLASLDRSLVEPVAVLLNESWCAQAIRALGVCCAVERGHLYDRARKVDPARRLAFTVASILDRLPHVPLSPIFDWLIHRRLIRRIQGLLRRHRIDVVHLNTQIHRDFFGLWASRAVRVPCVSHLRSHFSGLAPAKARLANRWVARFLAVSEGCRDHWVREGISPGRIEILPNAILEAIPRPLDLHAEWAIPRGHRLVGSVGRLTERRQYDWLLRAFARVRERHPDTTLVLVGDGERRREFASLAESLRISRWVRMPGEDPRGKAIVASLDVFVSCLDVEPHGRVLLEAWQAGVPVVAARVEPLGSVRHEENALLYEPGSVADLTGQVLRALDSRELRDRLAERGRATCRGAFGAARYADRLLAVYRGAISGNAARDRIPRRARNHGGPRDPSAADRAGAGR